MIYYKFLPGYIDNRLQSKWEFLWLCVELDVKTFPDPINFFLFNLKKQKAPLNEASKVGHQDWKLFGFVFT